MRVGTGVLYFAKYASILFVTFFFEMYGPNDDALVWKLRNHI